MELNGSLTNVKACVNSDLQIIEVHVGSKNSILLLVHEHWGVTVHQTFRENSRVSVNGLVEHTEGFVALQVEEVSSIDSNLSETFDWSASRLDVGNIWLIVVQVVDRRGVGVWSQGDTQVISTWGILGWGDTKDLRGRQVSAWHLFGSEFTSDGSSIFKVRSSNDNLRSSLEWTFSWGDVEQERWFVVVEEYIVVGVLDTVQGHFDWGVSVVVGRRTVAQDLG